MNNNNKRGSSILTIYITTEFERLDEVDSDKNCIVLELCHLISQVRPVPGLAQAPAHMYEYRIKQKQHILIILCMVLLIFRVI